PFFRPRDGLVPMPTISSSPSAVTSPTSATTLEVPMSRPTIILPLCTLAMILTVLLDSLDGNRRFGRRRRHRLTPRHGQAVGIAQVDTRNVRNLRSERLVVDAGETPHLVHQMIPPQQNVHALSRADEPAAVLAQLQAADGEAQRPQQLTEHLVLLHHPLLGTLRPGQQRQVFVIGRLARSEGPPLVVEQRTVTPARHWQLLF